MPTLTAPVWFDPAPYDSAEVRELVSGGTRISYRTGGGGAGPRILFVHGGRAHATWWAHQVALFGAVAPKWAALDLSGHGDSGWRDEYGADTWLEELRAVAATLARDDELVLVGHSLGGMLSILLAVSGTVDGIARVVSVDAVPLDPDQRQGPAEPSNSTPLYPELESGVAAFAERSARRDWPAWLAHFVGARSLRPSGEGWEWRHDSSPRIIERPVITEFGALDLSRFTLITGTRSPYRDSILSSQFVRRAADELHHESLDAGHDVMMERPEEFHRLLCGLLELSIRR